MRLAVLDLGTNSVRMDIYEVLSSQEVELLAREKVMVRLGQDLFASGRLHDEAMTRTIKALRRFRGLCQKLLVEEELALATSALREAGNGAEFVEEIYKASSFKVEVISGEEEARLILLGILQDQATKDGSFGFVDIGGGSTEFGVTQNGRVAFLESLPLGAARLNQLFLRGGPDVQAFKDMRIHIREVLEEAKRDTAWGPLRHSLGSSGSVRAVQNILEEIGRGKQIRLAHLIELNERMVNLSPEELLDVPGMNPSRLDIVVAGSIVLEEAMRFFGTPVLEYTDFALRDGILLEFMMARKI